MKEVRIMLDDNLHADVKTYGQDNDLKLGEAIGQLLVIGLGSVNQSVDTKKKGKK